MTHTIAPGRFIANSKQQCRLQQLYRSRSVHVLVLSNPCGLLSITDISSSLVPRKPWLLLAWTLLSRNSIILIEIAVGLILWLGLCFTFEKGAFSAVSDAPTALTFQISQSIVTAWIYSTPDKLIFAPTLRELQTLCL